MTLSDALRDIASVTVEVINPEHPFGAVQVFPEGGGSGGGGAVNSVFGRTGDIIASCSDYASCYASVGTGIPAGGLPGQVLSKNSSAQFDAGWGGASIPAGGTMGQVLSKASSAPFDIAWEDASTTGLPILTGKSRLMADGSFLLFNATTNKYHEITLTGPDGAVYPIYGPGVP